MSHEIETLTFTSTAQYVAWVDRVVKYKYQKYDRVPDGCVLTYGDGHVYENGYGRKGGTMLANLSFERALHRGMDGNGAPVSIDERGGMMLEIRWPE